MSRLACHALLVLLLFLSLVVSPVFATAKTDEPPAKKESAQSDSAKKDKKSAKKKPAKADEKIAPAKKDDSSKKKEEKKDGCAKPESTKKDDSAKKDATAKKDGGEKKEPTRADESNCASLPKYEVEKSPFAIEVVLRGVFEAKEMTDVVLRPEQWGSFTVLKAVEHGARVKRGDLLVTLDMEKIDQAIVDLRTKLRLADLDMEKAKEQLAAMEKLTPMDLATAERDRRIAREDLAQMLDVELPTAKKTANFILKMSGDQLDYQKEELRQLEKMYKADDLTEETEEIVLRRARDTLARAQFSYELSKLWNEQTMKFMLPRQEESVKESTQRKVLGADQAKILLPLALQKQRIDLERMKVEQQRDDKRLQDLLNDRAAMIIKAPVDGIVYYGRCVEGKWSGGTSPEQFQRGASLSDNRVFMTIVQPRPLLIRAAASERDSQYVHAGLKGIARPTSYPDNRLPVVVSDVARVPSGETTFDTKFLIADEIELPLMPGMNCAVKMIGYQKKDAITVPPSALKTDPLDDSKYSVFLVDKKGNAAEHPVTIGKRNEKQIEILKGLSVGDRVLRECPKDDDKRFKKTDEKTPAAKPASQKKPAAEKAADKKTATEKSTDQKK
jgi:HlyD family secretion protein